MGRHRTALIVAIVAMTLGLSSIVPARATSAQGIGGTVVVTDLRAGEVNMVDGAGKLHSLASGLQGPRGVVVLADGSVLVAEYYGERVIGIGGKYGPQPSPVLSLPTPEGLTIGPDGVVYVTSLTGGEVGKIDASTGAYTKILGDLKGPSGVAVRDDIVYVAESTNGDVLSITNGRKAVAANGFTRPIGVAAGPGKSLFVADFDENKVVRVGDDGKQSDFVTVPSPVHIALDPPSPAPDQPFNVVVASAADGLIRFDSTGARVGATKFDQAVGVVVVGPGQTVPVPAATETTVSTTVPATASTTRAVRPTTTASKATTTTVAIAEEEVSSSGLPIALIVLTILVAGGAGAFLLSRKPRGSAEAGFEEHKDEIKTVAEAFGPCAVEEVELAEAEGALRSVDEQLAAAETRAADAAERASLARERQEIARQEIAAHEGQDDEGEPTPPETQELPKTQEPAEEARHDIKVEDLGLTTDEGRAALDAFRKGEIPARVLQEKWRALGEDNAIETVRAARERLANVEGDQAFDSAHSQAVDEEAAARAELLRAERDVAEAKADLARMAEREHQCQERIIEARRRLEDCKQGSEDHDAHTRAALGASFLGEDVTDVGDGEKNDSHNAEGKDLTEAGDSEKADTKDEDEGEAFDPTLRAVGGAAHAMPLTAKDAEPAAGRAELAGADTAPSEDDGSASNDQTAPGDDDDDDVTP